MATPIISADSHVTEHPDAYRKFAASTDVADAPHVERNDSGSDVYVIPGMRSTIPVGLVAAAGRKPDLAGRFEDWYPSGWDPRLRAADQDRDGVTAEFIYPTVGMVLCNHTDLDYKRRLHAGLQPLDRRLLCDRRAAAPRHRTDGDAHARGGHRGPTRSRRLGLYAAS